MCGVCLRGVFACVCVCDYINIVSVMRCSLHPSVLLVFTSSEGYTGGEREREKEINSCVKSLDDNIGFICQSPEQ